MAGLNDILGPNTYSYINTGTIGTDAIKVAIIYRTTTVTPSGDYAILDDVVPFNTNTRPPVVQTFVENATGRDFTVVVNHCCPVANLFNQLVGVRGGQVEVVWPVAARGMIQ